MNWKVRHEGSPTHLEMPLEQIQQGLADGLWEPTDEVMGPNESEWMPIESHPALAELADELEPPPPRTYDDETRLDMTPLIDVCLVLLVFFMITSTMAALQTRLEAPGTEKDAPKIPILTKEQVEKTMILCTVTMENDEPVIRVEDKVVSPARLMDEFRSRVRATNKTTLLLQCDGKVPHGVAVGVIDTARGAGMAETKTVVPPVLKKK